MTTRGCGKREQAGLYAVVATSPHGQPVDYFLVDPVLPWEGPGLRAPMLQPDTNGFNHMIMGVGSHFYPYVPDFVEEARTMGVSKRVPRNFDFSTLTPGKSKMLLVHPRALPRFRFGADFLCQTAMRRHDPVSTDECAWGLWPLSMLASRGDKHKVSRQEDGRGLAETPSCKYTAAWPKWPEKEGSTGYRRGIFIALPLAGFEFVSRRKALPADVKERADRSKFQVEVKPD